VLIFDSLDSNSLARRYQSETRVAKRSIARTICCNRYRGCALAIYRPHLPNRYDTPLRCTRIRPSAVDKIISVTRIIPSLVMVRLSRGSPEKSGSLRRSDCLPILIDNRVCKEALHIASDRTSVQYALDNYFPLPDPFHAALSKTRAPA
jgi:hypothetical protein